MENLPEHSDIVALHELEKGPVSQLCVLADEVPGTLQFLHPHQDSSNFIDEDELLHVDLLRGRIFYDLEHRYASEYELHKALDEGNTRSLDTLKGEDHVTETAGAEDADALERGSLFRPKRYSSYVVAYCQLFDCH